MLKITLINGKEPASHHWCPIKTLKNVRNRACVTISTRNCSTHILYECLSSGIRLDMHFYLEDLLCLKLSSVIFIFFYGDISVAEMQIRWCLIQNPKTTLAEFRYKYFCQKCEKTAKKAASGTTGLRGIL